MKSLIHIEFTRTQIEAFHKWRDAIRTVYGKMPEVQIVITPSETFFGNRINDKEDFFVVEARTMDEHQNTFYLGVHPKQKTTSWMDDEEK